MSSYGLLFEFRVPPAPAQRASRYRTPATGDQLRIGVPVVASGTPDANGRLEVDLASGATTPDSGIHGILVYEYAPSAYAGTDPALTTFSADVLSKAPLNAPVQLCSGKEVKFVLRNRDADDAFVGNIGESGLTNDAIVMVAGLGATPTLAVGNYLEPGTGDDTDGYWAETSTRDNAWAVITGVNASRGEVEARMMF